MGDTPTYEQIHAGLFFLRGKASDHPCIACGDTEKAHQWAYQHTAAVGDELCDDRGQPYSLDLLNDYAPMCTSCHRKLDSGNQLIDQGPRRRARMAADPEFDRRMREAARKPWQDKDYADRMARLSRERWADPEHVQRMSDVTTERWQDPEFRQHMSEVTTERWQDPAFAQLVSDMKREQWQDPAYAEHMREVARAQMARRRACAECDLVSHPAAVGRHQKASGHSGYEDVEVAS